MKIEKNCGLKNQDGGNRKGHDWMSLGTSGVGVCEIKIRPGNIKFCCVFYVNVIQFIVCLVLHENNLHLT